MKCALAPARLCEEGEACSDEAIQDVDLSLLKSTSWIASSEQASPSSQRRAKASHHALRSDHE
jgi:hypothetical protein